MSGARGKSGGARSNAGRKPGTQNKINEARKAEAIAGGPLPLEVIMEQMRYWHEKAQQAKKKGAKEERIEALMDAALTRAKEAAPFIHPKLQSITHKEEPIDLTKLPRELIEQAIELEQAIERVRSGETTH